MGKEKYILETDRTRMRPHTDADADYMIQLNSDPEVVRYTGDVPFENRSDVEKVIQRVKSQWEFDRTGRFVVELKSTGEIIGWCGLRWFPELSMHDLGYRFFKRHWGKGYATETSLACLVYAKDVLKLKRVFASAMGANRASLRVLEKLGFKPASLPQANPDCELNFLIEL